VPLVQPSPTVTTEVETVPVALAQPEGDVSSARTPEPREAWVESWTLRRVHGVGGVVGHRVERS
jgi:hypothetical protein